MTPNDTQNTIPHPSSLPNHRGFNTQSTSNHYPINVESLPNQRRIIAQSTSNHCPIIRA